MSDFIAGMVVASLAIGIFSLIDNEPPQLQEQVCSTTEKCFKINITPMQNCDE